MGESYTGLGNGILQICFELCCLNEWHNMFNTKQDVLLNLTREFGCLSCTQALFWKSALAWWRSSSLGNLMVEVQAEHHHHHHHHRDMQLYKTLFPHGWIFTGSHSVFYMSLSACVSWTDSLTLAVNPFFVVFYLWWVNRHPLQWMLVISISLLYFPFLLMLMLLQSLLWLCSL